MRFTLGQKVPSKAEPRKVAEVVQLRDEGREAWVQVRDLDGALVAESWVNYVQFAGAWDMARAI